MKRFAALALLLPALIRAGPAFTQDAPPGSLSLIPHLVYVGDPARLVLDLGPDPSSGPGEVIDDPRLLPAARNLVISRVELERRQGRSRLIVDFRAYAPGLLEFPPLRLGTRDFSGLRANIASILDAGGSDAGDNRVLSPPAPPLAPPGAMTLIYGFALGLLLLVALIVAGRRSLPLLRRLRERRLRRRKIRGMGRLIRQLTEALREGGAALPLLERLNREFRLFLTFISGENCLNMVPGDFEPLPEGPQLCRFFRRADNLRFRGGDPAATEAAVTEAVVTAELLEEARLFLEAAAREEPATREEAPPGESPEALPQRGAEGFA
ncbi:MAG: hypothetical protein LBQ35_03905 [Spirochaetaceae bacterium]|jgi:hypothetical protein|nr:hypothetical protein [Spirochaetaceae bacterium]